MKRIERESTGSVGWHILLWIYYQQRKHEFILDWSTGRSTLKMYQVGYLSRLTYTIWRGHTYMIHLLPQQLQLWPETSGGFWLIFLEVPNYYRIYTKMIQVLEKNVKGSGGLIFFKWVWMLWVRVPLGMFFFDENYKIYKYTLTMDRTQNLWIFKAPLNHLNNWKFYV